MNLREAAAKKRAQQAKKPPPLFAAAKARKAKPAPKPANRLAELRARKEERRKLSKQIIFGPGAVFHNCQRQGNHWTVDITDGDHTVTAHNMFGSWMIGQPEKGAMQREPAFYSIDVFGIHECWLAKLKEMGIERRLPHDPPAKPEAKKKAAKEKAKKPNPWLKAKKKK